MFPFSLLGRDSAVEFSQQLGHPGDSVVLGQRLAKAKLSSALALGSAHRRKESHGVLRVVRDGQDRTVLGKIGGWAALLAVRRGPAWSADRRAGVSSPKSPAPVKSLWGKGPEFCHGVERWTKQRNAGILKLQAFHAPNGRGGVHPRSSSMVQGRNGAKQSGDPIVQVEISRRPDREGELVPRWRDTHCPGQQAGSNLDQSLGRFGKAQERKRKKQDGASMSRNQDQTENQDRGVGRISKNI